MQIFETSRLIIRQYQPGDFENFFLLNGDEEVVRYIRPVQNREEAQETFSKLLEEYIVRPDLGRWAVHTKDTNEFAGSFAIIPLPWNRDKIQLGYAFPKVNWGKGYATEVAVKGLEHAMQVMKLPEIYGITEVPNVASQKVLLKAGFVFEGMHRDDKGIDLHVYIHRNK